jgi:hypothetical protein
VSRRIACRVLNPATGAVALQLAPPSSACHTEGAYATVLATRKLWAKARYFFFFDPDGKTLATALTIEPATLATTPFLELRFFARGFVFDFVRAFGAVLDFAFFFAAVFAITDSSTLSPFQITPKFLSRRFLFPCRAGASPAIHLSRQPEWLPCNSPRSEAPPRLTLSE